MTETQGRLVTGRRTRGDTHEAPRDGHCGEPTPHDSHPFYSSPYWYWCPGTRMEV